MNKKLETTKAVEKHLRILRDVNPQFPMAAEMSDQSQGNETADQDLLDLIWEKVARQAPAFIPIPIPAIALCSAAFVVVFAFWAYQHFAPVPVSEETAAQHIALEGVILDASGAKSTGRQQLIREGSVIATDGDTSTTFFLPEAGYLHLENNSSLEVKTARKEWPSGQITYELILHKGKLYSRLNELEHGSIFRFETEFGQARVVGTDFLLEVQRYSGMFVDVLKGAVGIRSVARPETQKVVTGGKRAFVSPGSAGMIYVGKVSEGGQAQLRRTFEEIFEGSASQIQTGKAIDDPKYWVVSRREE